MPRSSSTTSRFASLALLAALLPAGAATVGTAFAQDAGGVLAPGNAVVTGFSGTHVPPTIPAGSDPADLTEIDLSGPSARVIDLQSPGGPPQAQVLQAPKPFTVTADKIGQVFGVALDDASPPNIYLGATSAYGLPIIAPGPNGGPIRAKQGTANASFMPGLFGPAQSGGGPGSIWRVDGASGEVRLFANVTLDGVANSGPALGGLAFDPASHTLFAADRATGMIHAFDPSGAERGRFDHGTQGRTAAGLAPVPYDPARRLDIANPAFKTDATATWGYAADDRRIFGLGVRAGRLYYAVAGEQVWSVAINADGSFGADARTELQVPPWDADNEISKIIFDDQGRMLLAERAMPTGAYDFAALAREGIGRVLRYRPAEPAQGASAWQQDPDEYAIGFPSDLRNDNGGIAIGYSYTPGGTIDRATCGGFLWSTGEQLRVTKDAALAAQLAAGGPPVVNGLQGNGIDQVRPANVPPLATYFADYDDKFDDADARGHLGDLAIRRICGQAAAPSIQPPFMTIPVVMCQLNEFRLPNGECCDRRYVRRGRCEGCPPDEIRLPNGQCCDRRLVRDGRCGCPRDEIRLPNGQCCDPRLVRDGRCGCPPDEIRLPNGQCCDPRLVRDGRCGCPPDEIRLPNGACCDRRYVRDGRCVPPQTCPEGQIRVNGQCCDRRYVRDGRCVPPQTCPEGQIRVNGQCCDRRYVRDGRCVPPPVIQIVPRHRIVVPPRIEPPHRRPHTITPRWRQPRTGTTSRQPHFRQPIFHAQPGRRFR